MNETAREDDSEDIKYTRRVNPRRCNFIVSIFAAPITIDVYNNNMYGIIQLNSYKTIIARSRTYIYIYSIIIMSYYGTYPRIIQTTRCKSPCF